MDFGSGEGNASLGSRDITVGDLDELSMNAGSLGESSILHQSIELVTQSSWAHYYYGRRVRLRGIRQMPASVNGIWPRAITIVEKRDGKYAEQTACSQLVYRNVCMDEDPPCSIAISPTRQCVAFGCRSGVELYWVDSTTGQNLNRWFPLTRPSDHLYFLPPRRNIDSRLRLRLISSAANEHPSLNQPNSNDTNPNQLQKSWFTLANSWHFLPTRLNPGQSHAFDHSYGLPLSDGHHILFTNTKSGQLCLGSDTPASSVRRLSRKFVFEAPAGMSSGPASVYAAAADLSGGVRIVAVYGCDIVLHSVPPDALRYSTAEQEQRIQDPSVPFEKLTWVDVLQHPTSNSQALVSEAVNVAARFERLNM